MPSLGGTALCACTSLPSAAKRSRRRPGDLCQPASPRAGSMRGDGRVSQVPGEPRCAHALLFDPSGTSAPGHRGASVLPSAATKASAPTTIHFRGSFTRPAHSLSTLRHHDHSWQLKTRFRRLARLCRAGLTTRWVPQQGFRVCYISSSLPRLVLAHSSNWTETYAKDSSQVDVVRRRQRADRRPAQRDRWGRAAVSALRVPRLRAVRRCTGRPDEYGGAAAVRVARRPRD